MTSSEEATAFTLLDSYSRSRHQCFVAEFDFRREETGYVACFRPTGVGRDSPNRYACRYLHFSLREITEAAERKQLPASISQQLDKELPALGQVK